MRPGGRTERGCHQGLLRGSDRLNRHVGLRGPVLAHFATYLPEAAGYSLVQLIETSAVTGHFCDASGDAYLDVFSCKDFDPEVAIGVVERHLRPESIRKVELARRLAIQESEGGSGVIVSLFGLLFGLSTAFPVGVQSFVVMNQGLRFGYPRVLFGIVTASLCGTLLIVAGAAGASVLLADADEWGPVLLIGIAFLAIFGVLAFRSPPEEEAEEVNSVGRHFPMIAQTVEVSLFNPHAVLEMVGVLGGP